MPDTALNSDLGGRQLLYGERYFPEMVLALELKGTPSGYNNEGYDGYIFYQEMPWEVPTEVGAGRGIFQTIPDKGHAGWVCLFNGESAEERYTCKAQHLPEDVSLTDAVAPDLKWDDYDVPRGF